MPENDHDPLSTSAATRKPYEPAPQSSFRWWEEVLFYVVPIFGWVWGYKRGYWVSFDAH